MAHPSSHPSLSPPQCSAEPTKGPAVPALPHSSLKQAASSSHLTHAGSARRQLVSSRAFAPVAAWDVDAVSIALAEVLSTAAFINVCGRCTYGQLGHHPAGAGEAQWSHLNFNPWFASTSVFIFFLSSIIKCILGATQIF